MQETGFDPWVRKMSWWREWPSVSVALPGGLHGQRSLAGCSLWGGKELDTTERLMLYKDAATSQCVVASAIQQSESATHLHISPLPWISFPIRTPQCVVEFPVLCSRCSLVVCFIWVWICQSQSPSSPHPLLSPLCIHVFVLYISVSISSLLIRSSAPFSQILHNFILASTSVCLSANGTSSFLFMAAYFSFFVCVIMFMI